MAAPYFPPTDNKTPPHQTVFDRNRETFKEPARPKWASPIVMGAAALVPFAIGVYVTMELTRSSEAIPVKSTIAKSMHPHTLEELVELSATKDELSHPHSLEELVELSTFNETATRGEPLDLLSPHNPMAAVLNGLRPNVAPDQPDEEVLQVEAIELLEHVAQVGPALSFDTDKPVETVAVASDPLSEVVNAERAEARAQEKAAERALGLHMRMLREGVLAGVYDVEADEFNGKRLLRLRPVNLELSQRFMKQLLNTAAARGEVRFPKGLSTEDGRVDLDTMIFNLVQNSLANDGTLEGTEAAREMTMRAFEAVKFNRPKVGEEHTYTVEPGDSLAYISLKFYGRPSDYDRIFNANRAVLSTPDKIRVGQKLVIPG